ncbi:HYExAFE family protein [Urbifossiella limnaea]|uniref:Uncharacterized protein n=1 Tax=Urbifossiella limnaea TaxID=2528023 RepID=A0A517XVS7_9BACT|nr:HYExAFE family protein [Urbifossiella limnaea]QDU21610.1 hypothetical protein ETAA1_35800 [Urbifossiella limnaea]
MNRDNHYEAAFEAFLRARGVAVVPVVEARRSYLDDEDAKSPDFLVIGPDDARLVVDVKGRKFPGGAADRPRKVWEHWATRSDVTDLARWAARLGPGFRGVLAFVYQVLPTVALPDDTLDLFAHAGRSYLARGVAVEDYAGHMRPRSPRWGTVDIPTDTFRQLVKPFTAFLEAPEESVV